ncbi:hypothetical protein V6N11_050650 [Hibiscus sabdariffa]|uniref:Uncharacterized protein n=1 Tax=Hibiscus sabdariffa TaxID=183260 RepID=A0ABR2TAG3_9ROSI
MASASLPSSPPPPSPPSISASHSESTVALATSLVPQMPQVDAAAQNGTLNVDDQKFQIADHFAHNSIGHPCFFEPLGIYIASYPQKACDFDLSQ